MGLFRSTSRLAPPVPTGIVDRRKLWEEFRNDHKTLTMLRVTPAEVAKLQTVVMLSGYTEKRQLIDALNRIRCGFQA
jgi:hypothetical protein